MIVVLQDAIFFALGMFAVCLIVLVSFTHFRRVSRRNGETR